MDSNLVSPDDPTPVGGAAVEEIDRDLREVRRQREKNLSRSVWEWLVVVVVAVGAALLIRVFLFQQYYIDGPSMESTLEPSDRVLVNKLSYRLHDVHRGDVVVFDRVTSADQHDDLIKRVIALPGERLEVRSCVIYIDGIRLEEPYLDDELISQPDPTAQCGVHTDMMPTVVPDDMVFVMGDNRPQSFDSRDFGPIDIDKIRGRAFTVIWPLTSMSFL